MSKPTVITVPELGDFDEVEIIDVLIKDRICSGIIPEFDEIHRYTQFRLELSRNSCYIILLVLLSVG